MNTTKTTLPESHPQLPGIPRKSLDNPLPPKPTYATDAECAFLLEAVLRRIPARLTAVRASPFPLLTALMVGNSDVARQLIFVAAAIHRSADERRTAEYLLRNRGILAGGRRPAASLLGAARCAAEMDLRRLHTRDLPIAHEALFAPQGNDVSSRLEDPSVGEVVVERLRIATGEPGRPITIDRVLDATAIALDLARRHSVKGGKGPSLLAMRCGVRKDARLVTHLRAEFANDTGARTVARLLVGADAAPIEHALLWWAARPISTEPGTPALIATRWMRYVRTADTAFTAAGDSAASICACELSTPVKNHA